MDNAECVLYLLCVWRSGSISNPNNLLHILGARYGERIFIRAACITGADLSSKKLQLRLLGLINDSGFCTWLVRDAV